MKTWDIMPLFIFPPRLEVKDPRLEHCLAEDWEPFQVTKEGTGYIVWFKKEVKA